MPLIALVGAKGGIGKTTLASGILGAAARAGIPAVGYDLDQQRSLSRWGAKAGTTLVVQGSLPTWRDSLPESPLVVADAGPGLDTEAAVAGMTELAVAADLALMPAPPREMDLEAVGRLGRLYGAVFVLNMVDGRRPGRAKVARDFLSSMGEVCPIEVPLRAAIEDAVAAGQGAPVPELWAWVAGRLRLRR